ncbi:N-acetylgalactosamine-6-sulfatase [Steroidobacter agaridevorans]|uniref:N-acetylgalactosamine-6-sulfatase n=1 Tax=Steroidobacter agaridevorans TaxID=2695856 RepID=A0A829Y9I0_9GAMM|nr:sulfatase-like hydrolase/transferase [Steroidobacter agaridevorans]GFE79581.1 N-acetylgalactosamine-6-sulfatase [Steroidobacter agaridevorans]GFE88586.1 N-acetylgalactosamine-6-sulfatase [Steroidobacter agaridevorans]
MSRPNFIFIMADDMGCADLGCYGGRSNCSPVLDRMATEGARFTNGYSNSPVCSPARFALMTGRYQHRLRGGFDEPIASGGPLLGLPPEHPTLPSLLRDAGYSTALIGKWHLGSPPWFSPEKSGYQEFFGFRSGAVDFFTHRSFAGPHDLWEGDAEAHVDGYLTDILSKRAADYIRRKANDGPYMLSVHYSAPHWPWETRDDRAEAERIKSLFHLDGGSVEIYQRMIHHMDEGIGWILQAIEETGGRDNTLVVFTSDNGAERFSDTWPFVGKKMDLLEGGIRVPYVVRWPARIKPNTVNDRIVMGMDWMPTFLAAAGVAPHRDYPLDGVDMFGPAVERKVFWRMIFRNQKAVRAGDWKWLCVDGNEFLFNLQKDQRERANLRYREPERFMELRRAYFEWDEGMPLIPEDAKYTLAYNEETLAKSVG